MRDTEPTADEAQYQADVTSVGDIIGTVPIEDDADNPYDAARRILRSPWLTAHDAELTERVRAEAREGYVPRSEVYDDEQMRAYVEEHMEQIIQSRIAEALEKTRAAYQRAQDARWEATAKLSSVRTVATRVSNRNDLPAGQAIGITILEILDKGPFA